MSRSGAALLSVLVLVGSALVGNASAAAHPDPHLPLPAPPAGPDGAPEGEGAAPTVAVTATVDSGPLPLTVGFDVSPGADPYGSTYTWDFTEDGIADAAGPAPSWTFTAPGQHIARVTVTDEYGGVSLGELPVTAGNTRPAVAVGSPVDGGFADPGAPLPFTVSVTDPEDGAVDCAKVVVTYEPRAAVRPGPDCTGVVPAVPGAGHGPVLRAEYTDGGAEGVPPLTGAAEIVLHPREYQVRDLRPGSVAPVGGDWFRVPHVDLAGIDHLAAEFAPGPAGVNLAVHADSPAGPVVASFAVPPTAAPDEQGYRWLAADVTDPGGVHDLYFVADRPLGLLPGSPRAIRFQTVPATTTTVSPAGDWHTTDVTVSVAAAPLWDPQVSLDGGATWVPSPAVVAAEGSHEVLSRAVDAAGRTTAVAAAAVRLDRTGPAVGVLDREYGHTTVLDVPVTDAGSGVASGTVAIDGVVVPAPVELWRHGAGTHTLTVTATDVAGNTTTSTTELEITTSLAELSPLMAGFDLPFLKEMVLRLQLMAAQSAIERGDRDGAVRWATAFRSSASRLRDADARTTLTEDATLVVTHLRAS